MARLKRRHALSSIAAVWALLALSCAEPAAPRPRRSSPASTAATPHSSVPSTPLASTPIAAPTTEASPPSTTTTTPPPCARMTWVDACAKRPERAWLDADAVEAWYKVRGTNRPQSEIEPTCREIIVGDQGEAALLCHR